MAAKGRIPFSSEISVDLNRMTLGDFQLWSEPALKAYLSLRKKSIEGSFDELAARAFIAWEDKAAVDPDEEQTLRSNLSEYKSRLFYKSTSLPDPFTLHTGWLNEEGRCNWPSLYFSDIAAYLKMTTPSELYHRLCNEYKQGKAYRYFTAGLVKEVHFHPINDHSDVAFLAAKVSASMRVNSPPHQAWVCARKDTTNQPGGEIMSAYCTCTAGLKGCCNHVAGILYRVEYAVRTGLTKPTSTSQKCVWNVPSGSVPSDPIKLCEQTWKKDQYFKQDDGGHSKSVQHLASAFSPLSKRQENYVARDIKGDLADILRQEAPESCFVQLFDKLPFQTKEKPVCPPCPKEIAVNLGHPVEPQQLCDAMKLSDEQINAINEATMGQADSDEWHKQRIGRITASNFHRVYTRTKTLNKDSTANPTALLKSLFGYSSQPSTIAIKHGRSMEPHAKRHYQKLQSRNHRKFQIQECGLIVDKELPFLGASPDLSVICYCKTVQGCSEKGLCEIKCPESIKDEIPSAVNYSHLIIKDGINTLSHSSPYFTQIQGQMAVLNLNYCDFFVYTSKGHHLERLFFDQLFWDDVQEKLTEFWFKYMAPEVIYGTLATCNQPVCDAANDHNYLYNSQQKRPLPQSSEFKKCPLTKPKLSLVYLCGKCGEDIQNQPKTEQDESVECSRCSMWFHVVCSKVKDLSSMSQKDWFCQNCI